MGVNILQGDRPLFFYGQPYFGALEAYLAAFYIQLFGFSELAVSLAPISFTIAWIISTYLLFARCHSKAAGLIAAACTAFPGYYIFLYSVATYGGYSLILCIGTTMLWLSLRILQDKPYGTSLGVQGILLGLLMATGIWVHPLTFPYIVIAIFTMALFVVKKRFTIDSCIAFGGSALLALTGFLPYYFTTGSLVGFFSKRPTLTLATVSDALDTLFNVNIHELLVWDFRSGHETPILSFILEYTSIGLLIFAVFLTFSALLRTDRKKATIQKYLLPFSFCCVFLLMYVQNHMATLRAPRYAIGFFTMLLCITWSICITSQRKRALKILSIALFCCWISFQLAGTVLFIANNHQHSRTEQKIIRDLVNTSRANKLHDVVTFGDQFFGYKALKLSMFAQNNIAFAHAELERCQSNAQATETDLQKGYLTDKAFKVSLENNLQELGVSYKLTPIDRYYIFSDLQQTPQYSMHAIPNEQIRIRHATEPKTWKVMAHLGDQIQDAENALQPQPGESITFDLKQSRKTCGLWLFTEQNLRICRGTGFGDFEVYSSIDDISYTKVYASLPQTNNAFHAGPQFFIGGLLIKGEVLFTPVYARYLKIHFLKKSPLPITELYIFETDGSLRQNDTEDISALVEQVKEQDLDFILADRWVSARLREEFKGSEKEDITLPRHSTKFKLKPMQHVVKPEKGQALVCDAAIATVCAKVLAEEYGKRIEIKRMDLQNYVLFTFDDTKAHFDTAQLETLLWNGHLPLHTTEILLFTKTRGVYHDSWTNGKGQYYDLNRKIDPNQNKEIIFHTHGWRAYQDISDLQMDVIANATTHLKFKEVRQKSFVFSLPDDLTRLNSLTIQSSFFIPPSADNRKLGLDIKRIEIH
jgi:hypothetical protein